MNNSDNSQSVTSFSDQQFTKYVSVTSIIRNKILNLIKNLSETDKKLLESNTDEAIRKQLRQKINKLKSNDTKSTLNSNVEGSSITAKDNAESGLTDCFTDMEFITDVEITVEEITEDSAHNLILENLQLLDSRLTDIEQRISRILLELPKQQEAAFEINRNIIKQELLKELRETNEQLDAVANIASKASVNQLKEILDEKEVVGDGPMSAAKAKKSVRDEFDKIYYEKRQNDMNKWRYKKEE